MRQWNVDPAKMCLQHRLGEHLECHMFVGAINQGTSLQGYLDKGLLDLRTLRQRHDELAADLPGHKSPLPEFVWSERNGVGPGFVDSAANEKALCLRCENCRKLQEKIFSKFV